jgi:hypothetical protein
MRTSPYTRSVFGADTGIGHIDPPNLHLDMGPYAGSPINPHAFASGHQYGAAPGLRGQFVMQSRRTGRLGATMPPVYNPNVGPVAQLTQSFAYYPTRGLRGIGPQFVTQSDSAVRQQIANLEKAQAQIDAETTALEQRVAAMNVDPSGKPAVAITPTVPVIPAQTTVMTAQNAATGQQTLTVSAGVPAPTHVSMGLVLVGLATGVLIAVSVRHMVH